MPQWLLWTLVVVTAAVALGFFALVFSEMAVKRERGRFSASRAAPEPGAQATRRPARKSKGSGNQGGASKSRKKRR